MIQLYPFVVTFNHQTATIKEGHSELMHTSKAKDRLMNQSPIMRCATSPQQRRRRGRMPLESSFTIAFKLESPSLMEVAWFGLAAWHDRVRGQAFAVSRIALPKRPTITRITRMKSALRTVLESQPSHTSYPLRS